MNQENVALNSPIDVIGLVHKAMAAAAKKTEQEAERIEFGGSLQPFKSAFNEWASAMLYVAETEDILISEVSDDEDPANRPAEVAVGGMMLAANEREHLELTSKLEDVLSVLNVEINRTSVIHRTKQHLHGRVLALRIAQEDHIENERAFVLPELRRRMSDEQQLEAARRLLIDDESEDPRWMLEWVSVELEPGEQDWLVDLEARIKEVSLKHPPANS